MARFPGGCSAGRGPFELDVSVRKDGCEEQNYRIRRNERPDYGASVFGYYLAVPMLWLSQYKDDHDHPFYCEQAVATE